MNPLHDRKQKKNIKLSIAFYASFGSLLKAIKRCQNNPCQTVLMWPAH